MKFTISDKKDIDRLAHIVNPSSGDISLIYELYKIYINPNAPYPLLSNCGCDKDISSYWRAVLQFGGNNGDKFIN